MRHPPPESAGDPEVQEMMPFSWIPLRCFDFAQDREPVERPVEPRISLCCASLVRNDVFEVLRHSL